MCVTPFAAGERRNVHCRGITADVAPRAVGPDSGIVAAIGGTTREMLTVVKFTAPQAKRAAVAPTIFTTLARAWPV